MSEIDAIVSKANRLHESRFQAFRFHAPNPAELHIKCGLPIQAVRIELPRKACLHVHSVSFVDSTGARLKASVANVQASSNYDNADGAAWLARIVEPDGAYPFAVHTLADSNPWIQLNLAEPISAAAIVIRNRAGRTARRTVGLSVSVLVDGAWTIVYDDESEFRRFVSEVAGHRHETGSDPDLLRGVVVLYAPTWRDNHFDARGYRRVSHIDPARILEVIGGNGRIVLRGHHNTVRGASGRQRGVVDATNHPDINDLLLAADLLITDYSSVMFDYVVTGKPVLFLVPDIEEYRDQTRGFCFDLEEVAPGPVCRSSDELMDALSRLGCTLEESSARYREFVARFAPRDDGGAAARVVDAVWGPISQPPSPGI